MKRWTTMATAALLATGLVVVADGTPAGAITVVSSGTTLQVVGIDATPVRFTCVSGTARVNGTAATPSLACSAVTSVTVQGGSEQNVIYLDDLNSGFSSLTSTQVTTGGGADLVWASRFPDNIFTGTAGDAVVVSMADPVDSSIALGGETNDALYLNGTSGNDTITVTNNVFETIIKTKTAGGSTINRSVSGLYGAVISGREGNDTIDASPLTNPMEPTYLSLSGDEGDDTLKGGPLQVNYSGGSGTNTMIGTGAADYFFSASDTDTISPGGGQNRIADEESLRSGGRTITPGGGTDTYDNNLQRGDATWRVRNAGAGAAQAVASLNRPGIQTLPSSVSNLGAFFDNGTEPDDHTLADIVALDGKTVFVNDGSKTAVVDITLPTGTATSTVSNGSGSVDPSTPGLGTITLVNVGPVSVHGPWTNKNRGFAHRATRDLLFRFASTADLDEAQALLGNGSVTRPQATAAWMDTDEYRGLDVDRVFVKYLRRKADPGGRTYWINSIENGKAMWRFRAQLFGSNEYFTKAGATNASYVEQAYNDVLGRSPDPSGKTYWTNKLNKGADRGSVALQFINSPESRRRLVDDQFLRFLDRKPTTSEQDAWVAQIPSNDGEQRLIAFLVNSGAYYDRT